MIITTIGVIAAILTTLAFVPQSIKTVRTRNTDGLSAAMYLLFTLDHLRDLDGRSHPDLRKRGHDRVRAAGHAHDDVQSSDAAKVKKGFR